MRKHTFTFPLSFVHTYALWGSWASGTRDWFPLTHRFDSSRLRRVIKYCESLTDLSNATRIAIEVDSDQVNGFILITFYLPE